MTSDRPRDILGRPLPRDADRDLVVAGVSPRADLSDEEAWAEAQSYLRAGMPFHAHEVFENRWRLAPSEDRLLWQALAQWGAALTHAARGNPAGAARVANRALANLQAASRHPHCVDLDLVRESCTALTGGGAAT